MSDPAQRKNLKAFLDVLGKSEGADYNTIVGGGSFSDFSHHPSKVDLVTKDGPSTAAGRYQFIKGTWESVAKKLGLKDFSPESQDKAAIELLRQHGALGDILNGDFHSAISKLGGEWQSLPSGVSKNQGKHSMAWFDKEMSNAIGSTPMPADAAAAKRAGDQQQIALRGSFEDLNVTVNMPNGEKTRHSLSPRFTRPNPAGDLGMTPPFATPY